MSECPKDFMGPVDPLSADNVCTHHGHNIIIIMYVYINSQPRRYIHARALFNAIVLYANSCVQLLLMYIVLRNVIKTT